MNARFLYQVLLWALAAACVILLFACAAGTGDGGSRSADGAKPAAYTPERPMRLVLAGSQARDSAAVVTEFFVDQALRTALDSMPTAAYITINYRDSLANRAVAEGRTGVALADLGRELRADGAIFTRVARFGGVLAVELRIVDPATAKQLYRDVSFSVVRFRDTTGTLFLGPTLYDAVRKSLAKFFRLPHTPTQPVATEPLVVSGIVIPAEPALGQLRLHRQAYSTLAVKAVGELARLNFSELVAFDYESRNQLLRTVGVAEVNDYIATEERERTALFNVGVDKFITGSVRIDGDSLRIRLELRYVTSRTSDTLIDVSERGYGRSRFETTKSEEDFVIAVIDVAEPLCQREADRVRAAYDRARTN